MAMLNNQMVHDVDENGSMMMFPNQAFYICVSPFKQPYVEVSPIFRHTHVSSLDIRNNI